MSSLLDFPRPFDEPDGYRALLFGEALAAQKTSAQKFAASLGVSLHTILRALSEPDWAPELIYAIDIIIKAYLESTGEEWPA